MHFTGFHFDLAILLLVGGDGKYGGAVLNGLAVVMKETRVRRGEGIAVAVVGGRDWGQRQLLDRSTYMLSIALERRTNCIDATASRCTWYLLLELRS